MQTNTFAGYLDIWPNEHTVVRVQVSEPLVIVDIEDLNFNLHARGNAKCDPHDTFSFDYGIVLAQTRAYHRLYSRLVKKLGRGPEHQRV